MSYIENPKTAGSNIAPCKPQVGKCSINCNQCFANRDCSYVPNHRPNIPTVEEVGDRIVRMNDLHDSNVQRSLVIETASKYKHVFFNTSLPNLDFPGPVVFTANSKEEEPAILPSYCDFYGFNNLMFVRLRVSASNLPYVGEAVRSWVEQDVPVVLTFMAYYEEDAVRNTFIDSCVTDTDLLDYMSNGTGKAFLEHYYVYKRRHINSYWCPTPELMSYVMNKMYNYGRRNVYMCGLISSPWCRDCHNCESFYWQTLKRIRRER